MVRVLVPRNAQRASICLLGNYLGRGEGGVREILHIAHTQNIDTDFDRKKYVKNTVLHKDMPGGHKNKILNLGL